MLWGRGDADIYYWRTALGESDGLPTKLWRFDKCKRVCYPRRPDAQKGPVQPTRFWSALGEFRTQDVTCECGACNCIFDMLGHKEFFI
jgi:hypothetical protein